MKPYIVRYTDNLPKSQLGNTKAFVVTIRSDQKYNDAVLAHEVEHVKQWYMMFIPLLLLAGLCWYFVGDVAGTYGSIALYGLSIGLHPLLYKFNHDYRLRCEVQAYKAQIKAGYAVHNAVRSLMHSSYRFKINRHKAIELLR